MKYILSILFSSFGLMVVGQTEFSLSKDTTLAHQYYAMAQDENLSDSLKIDFLSKAINIYDKYQLLQKLVESKSMLAYIKLAPEIAEETLQLVDSSNSKVLYESSLYAYMTMQSYHTLGNVHKGIEFGKKALQVVPIPSKDYYTIAFTLIGDYCYNHQVKDAEKLIEAIERYLENSQLATAPQLKVRAYRAQLQIKMLKGDYESATIYGQQCIAENQKHPAFSNKKLAPIYVEVGNCYARLKRFDEAIDWMKKGIEIRGLNDNDPSIASYYVNLATVYHYNGNRQAAIEYNEKATALLLPEAEKYKAMLRVILYNTSVYHQKLGNLEAAIQTIERTYQYGEKYTQYIHHGNVLNSLGNPSEALKKMQKALTLLSPNFDNEDIDQNPSKHESFLNFHWAGNALANKAAILIDLGVKEESESFLQQGLQVSELAIHVRSKYLNKVKGFESTKMGYNQGVFDALQAQARANQTLHRLTKKAEYLHDYFKTTERLKAMTLLEILSPSPLPSELVAQEEKIFQALQTWQQKVETAESDSLQFFQEQLFRATQKYESFVQQLRADFPKETGAFYNLNYTTIPQVQAQLDESELYIDYTYNIENGYLFILSISRKTTELKQVKTDKSFLDKLSSLQQLLKDPLLMQRAKRGSFIQNSHQLYQLLVTPIEEHLQHKSKIVIAPQKELFYLPFEVLLPSDAINSFGELDYWMKKYQISYQYSATIYHQLQTAPLVKDNSLLAFAPVFENQKGADITSRMTEVLSDSLLRSVEGDRFRPLPNSKREVENIAGLVSKNGQTKVLTEEEASKTYLMDALQAQSYQFIHLATHGIVNLQNPKLSALACFSQEESEEYLLYANEIQMQDLKADLVVLSSCESGIGQLINGEGLLALSRSFIYAGAKNVLFSLWKVNDQHTSTLMIDFYKNYAKGMSYSEALQKAKLGMLEKPLTANPRFWSSFVLIGD